MKSKFQREERYLVIKTEDIAHLSDADRQMLRHLIQRIHIIRTERGAEPLHCVVVEDDWPEYGLVWGLIEYRMMTGKHAPVALAQEPDHD